MKKNQLFFTLLMGVVLFGANTAMAQKQNVIKVNPLSLALSNISLSYERFITEKTSIQLQGGYWLGASVGDVKFSGTAFTPEVRFYVSDTESPKGFYVAPFGRYEMLQAVDKTDDDKATLTRVGGGAAIGYQFLFGKSVTMDLFGGPRYYSNSVKYDNTTNEEDLDLGRARGGFGLRLGLTVGVAF